MALSRRVRPQFRGSLQIVPPSISVYSKLPLLLLLSRSNRLISDLLFSLLPFFFAEKRRAAVYRVAHKFAITRGKLTKFREDQ